MAFVRVLRGKMTLYGLSYTYIPNTRKYPSQYPDPTNPRTDSFGCPNHDRRHCTDSLAHGEANVPTSRRGENLSGAR